VIWGRRESLRASYATLAGAVAIGAFLAWWPDREIVYSRRVTVIGCDPAARAGPCYAWAQLSIGNTGNVDQGVVRVRFPGAESNWQVHARASDIRASLEARAEPRLDRLAAAGAAVFEIRPLPRNTVVDLNAYCMGCPPEVVRGTDASRIGIESEGRATEGDPRAVTFFSGLLRLAAMLIPI
jgi:hypothetical protein